MEEQGDVISLHDYLVVLRRQRWVIVAVTVLVVVAALGVALAQTPRYEAETELALDRIRSRQDVTIEELLAPSNAAVETERLVLTSRPVAELVAERLGLPDHRNALEDVRVEIVGDTRVVRIIVNDVDPEAAAQRADAFAAAYLDVKRDQALNEVLAARSNLEDRAAGLRSSIAELEDQIEAAEDEEEAQALRIQRDALLAQLGQVIGETSSLGSATEEITGGGTVLTPAEVPETPVSPRPLRTGALALVLGLLLGVGAAFLRDYFDDVVRDEADFKRSVGGRPILGRIPHFGADAAERVVTLTDPKSPSAEAYRELSAATRFLLITHNGPTRDVRADEQAVPGRSVIVVSSAAGEGKTATAANLAVTAARVGLETILVDADLRKATLARRFGIGRAAGLSDVLLTGDDLDGHLLDVGVDHLRLLPAGTIPPNPAELLASPAMRALEQDLVAQADLVIYDTPAVLAVPDALELGRFVDLAILVGRANTTGRRQLHGAVERLEQVGTDLAGMVLNDVALRDGDYYYDYADERASAPSPWRHHLRRWTRQRRVAPKGRAEPRDGATQIPSIHEQSFPAVRPKPAAAPEADDARPPTHPEPPATTDESSRSGLPPAPPEPAAAGELEAADLVDERAAGNEEVARRTSDGTPSTEPERDLDRTREPMTPTTPSLLPEEEDDDALFGPSKAR